jgi:peptidylprolyl isomerase
MSKAETAKLSPLTIPAPSGPPPRTLRVTDIRVGAGPRVPKRDWVTNREEVYIRYVQASYPEARAGNLEGPFKPGRTLLEDSSRGLAMGLTGMKVGGRRELIVPPRLTYPRWRPSWGYAPYVTVYVVDLLGMEPPPDRRVEYRHRPWHPCFQSRAHRDDAKT